MGETQATTPVEALQLVERLMTSIPMERTYYQEPLPCVVDQRLERLCDWFSRASTSEREAFTSSLDRRHADFLLVFSERMATLAVRESSIQRLQNGLKAITMLSLSTLDFRESVLVLALHRHSAVKLGADPKKLILQAATCATAEVAEQLDAFAQRESVPIESMGFKETHSTDGFIYERTW